MPLGYSRQWTTVHNLHYHFIRCPKYRNKVLNDEVADWHESLVEEKVDELDLEIIDLAIQPDHVHLLISGHPKLAPKKINQQIKGYSSRVLRDEYDFGFPALWTRSYFVSTAGEVSSQVVKGYMEAQTDE